MSLHNTNCPVTTCCQTMEKKSKKCNQCDYISSCVSSLRKHLKIHSGEKSNKCSHCDFASYDAGYMREHLNKHSGEKTNKCDQCEFATSYASNAAMHTLRQAIWGLTWKPTVEKSQTNATNVTLHWWKWIWKFCPVLMGKWGKNIKKTQNGQKSLF